MYDSPTRRSLQTSGPAALAASRETFEFLYQHLFTTHARDTLTIAKAAQKRMNGVVIKPWQC